MLTIRETEGESGGDVVRFVRYDWCKCQAAGHRSGEDLDRISARPLSSQRLRPAGILTPGSARDDRGICTTGLRGAAAPCAAGSAAAWDRRDAAGTAQRRPS